MSHSESPDTARERGRGWLAGRFATVFAMACVVVSGACWPARAASAPPAVQHVAILEKALPADAKDQPPLQYWQEARTKPRTLRVHCLKVDLRSPRYEVVALVADRPAGSGPAHSQLESPLTLAAHYKAVAAVNTNFFNRLPDPPDKPQGAWALGRPTNICGWAVTGGRQISPPQAHYVSFWLDPQGGAHIWALTAPKAAREAVAGFPILLFDGRDVSGDPPPCHPRTALGLDREARWLWLVVVDGRQAGYSEGVTFRELAGLMEELGCWDALNVDGGGSSVMLADDGKGALQVMNRPSDRDAQGRNAPRSIPVMLGVRPR